MNNEPVAWIDPKELDMDVSTSVTKHKQFDGDIPLYTRPSNLTDEEIVEVINEHRWRGLTGYLLTFAHAILRKAQEK